MNAILSSYVLIRHGTKHSYRPFEYQTIWKLTFKKFGIQMFLVFRSPVPTVFTFCILIVKIERCFFCFFNVSGIRWPLFLYLRILGIQTFLFGFQMDFDKMWAICLDFKSQSFQISYLIWNLDHFQTDLSSTINNLDGVWTSDPQCVKD